MKSEKLLEESKKKLDSDEKIEHYLIGNINSNISGNATVVKAILIATEKRLFVYAKHLFGMKEEYKIFHYNSINSIYYDKDKTKLFFAGFRVDINTTNQTFSVFAIKENAEALVNYANKKILEAYKK